MKPVRIFCLSITFLLLLYPNLLCYAANQDARSASLEECAALPNFSVSFFRPKTGQEVKLYKNNCVWKLVVFLGKGEKIEVNSCKTEVLLSVYPSLEATTPDVLAPGSYACPQTALFGADFAQQSGDLERFEQQRSHIFDLLADGLSSFTDSNMKGSGGEVRCTQRVLKAYLETCKSFPLPEVPVQGAAVDAQPLPAGVLPQTLKSQK